jgi:CRP-like cAMP-binding protein
VVRYKVGDFFGELALLNGESRAATVIAKSGMCGSCQCLTIKKAEFEPVLGISGARKLFLAPRNNLNSC